MSSTILFVITENTNNQTGSPYGLPSSTLLRFNFGYLIISLIMNYLIWGLMTEMTLKTQRLFRMFGVIKGYYGEAIYVITAIPYICFLAFFKFVKPMVMLWIGTSDYECTNLMKGLFEVGTIFTQFCYPLMLQIIFLSFTMQMSSLEETRATMVE